MDSKVIMEVYNIAGQRVSELVNQNQTAGYYTVDFGASKLASGVYIYRISAQENVTGKNFSSIKKMMLFKVSTLQYLDITNEVRWSVATPTNPIRKRSYFLQEMGSKSVAKPYTEWYNLDRYPLKTH